MDFQNHVKMQSVLPTWKLACFASLYVEGLCVGLFLDLQHCPTTSESPASPCIQLPLPMTYIHQEVLTITTMSGVCNCKDSTNIKSTRNTAAQVFTYERSVDVQSRFRHVSRTCGYQQHAWSNVLTQSLRSPNLRKLIFTCDKEERIMLWESKRNSLQNRYEITK